MVTSIIVAKSENDGIGIENRLPWHLPADLKNFKNITMGHHMIMGRKTYESIGKPLPGRTTVIVTRDENYKAEGCIVVHSLAGALTKVELAGETEVFIIGGADVILQSESFADKIYLTVIHEEFPADVFLKLNNEWKEIKREDFTPDEKNKYNYSFLQLTKCI